MIDIVPNEKYYVSGPPRILNLGKRSAWASFILFIIYDAVVFAGGAFQGVFYEPYLTIAEILTIIGPVILIVLIAAIHLCAPINLRVYSLTAFGWILLLAGFTVAVHFVNLTLLKQIDPKQKIELVRFIGWEWPSMLYAIELVAWHLFFGMSMIFAAFVFNKKGSERTARFLLLITGIFCVIGLAGPLIGNLNWRLIGAFGYGFIFPVACIYIALVFKNASEKVRSSPDQEK